MSQTKHFIRNDRIQEYEETIREDDYLYEIPLKDCEILISAGGVSVFYADGVNHTNIIPERHFPTATSLSIEQLFKLLDILESTGYEGFFMTADDLNNEVWEDAAEDQDFPF